MHGRTRKDNMVSDSERRVQSLMRRLDQIDNMASSLPQASDIAVTSQTSRGPGQQGLSSNEPEVIQRAFKDAVTSAASVPIEDRPEFMVRRATECLQSESAGQRRCKQASKGASTNMLELRRELGAVTNAARSKGSRVPGYGAALVPEPTVVQVEKLKYVTLGGMQIMSGEETVHTERIPQSVALDDVRELMRKAEIPWSVDAEKEGRCGPGAISSKSAAAHEDRTSQPKPRPRGQVSYKLATFKELTEDAAGTYRSAELATKGSKQVGSEARRRAELAQARRKKRAQREQEAERCRIEFGPSLRQRQVIQPRSDALASAHFEQALLWVGHR